MFIQILITVFIQIVLLIYICGIAYAGHWVDKHGLAGQ